MAVARYVGPLLIALTGTFALSVTAARAQSPPGLRWGGDAEGGAPFVEADPRDPTRVVGFEVDIAQMLATIATALLVDTTASTSGGD